MRLAGIDLNLFTPHSTRSASTSATVNKVPIDTIIKTAGWSNDCTLRKFYKRPVSNDATFSSANYKLHNRKVTYEGTIFTSLKEISG